MLVVAAPVSPAAITRFQLALSKKLLRFSLMMPSYRHILTRSRFGLFIRSLVLEMPAADCRFYWVAVSSISSAITHHFFRSSLDARSYSLSRARYGCFGDRRRPFARSPHAARKRLIASGDFDDQNFSRRFARFLFFSVGMPEVIALQIGAGASPALGSKFAVAWRDGHLSQVLVAPPPSSRRRTLPRVSPIRCHGAIVVFRYSLLHSMLSDISPSADYTVRVDAALRFAFPRFALLRR